MENSDIVKLKRKFLKLIWDNEEIMTTLNYSEYDPEAPQDCMYKILFPYIKLDYTVQEVGTYIGLKVDCPSICQNELYKNFILTISVICNNNAMRTEEGGTRTDIICGKLVKMLNWNNTIGFTLELTSDVEDILNKDYYIRTVRFKSITSNSIKNGVKQY